VRFAWLLALSACASLSARPAERPPPEAVSGYWEDADGSGVVMQIALVEGVPSIDAWSVKTAAGDPEVHFEVADVSWDGRRLQATFTYPPTKTVTRSDLVLVNADRLEGMVSGPYQAKEVWVRTPPPQQP
jgi:hypothetical protein